jgi:glycosyltransferase involved in cell wall biosynthesis
VIVVPTTVAVPEGDPAPEPVGPMLRLGWIGSRATLPYLEACALPLSALVAAGRALRLVVVADRAPTLPPGIPVELVRWSLAGERAALEGVHVGLAPLPDDPWTRGKCGLRVLHFLAAGRPVVASPVGVQATQVRDGETGFLAREDADWVRAIERLGDDAALRARLGRAAREDARSRWSVDAWSPTLVGAVEEWLA